MISPGQPREPTFAEVLRRRRMIRSYRPDPVAPEVIERILSAAVKAPSAGFSQPHRFVVHTDQLARRRIATACGEDEAVARGLSPWLSVAPVHVVPCIEHGAYSARYAEGDKAASVGPGGWDTPFDWVDGGAALMLLLLGTVAEGLGAGFLAADSDSLRAAARVPQEWTPVGLVTVGHPASEQPGGSAVSRRRRPLEEVVRWNPA